MNDATPLKSKYELSFRFYFSIYGRYPAAAVLQQISAKVALFDILTACPKWRLDGLVFIGPFFCNQYVNSAYAHNIPTSD